MRLLILLLAFGAGPALAATSTPLSRAPGRALATELQVIHASAAIAAFGPLEVYLNQPATSTTPDATVSFRGGSAFLTVPSGQPLGVRVRLVNPPPFGLPREVSFTAPPLPAGRFVASLAGIPEQVLALYAQNPDGINRALQMLLTPVGARPAALAGGGVPVVVTNAVTDAPALTLVVLETGRTLASGLAYGQSVAAAALAPGTYTVSVRRTSDGTVLSASRFVVAADDASAAFTVSGFISPAANQGGPSVAVTSTDETGVANPGTPVASDDGAAGALALAVANPVRGTASVRYTLAESGTVRLAVFDALGREVAVLADGTVAAGSHTAHLDGLAPGAYVLRLVSGTAAASRPVTVVR